MVLLEMAGQILEVEVVDYGLAAPAPVTVVPVS
jgi:hypothetical protein